MLAIDIKNVTKRFKDKLILDNVSFEVNSGEIYGLIGPNGAGKSTLLNIITGILDQNSGEVFVCGNNIRTREIEAKKCIGYVMQDLALIETLTAKDNLEYFGALYGLSGKLLKERIDEVLEITGLKDTGKKKINKFSGGMKRRLNIAIGMVHHPRILILDEPTVGVDAQSRNHIFSFIRKIVKEWGTTVLYTSHYMEEVEELCDKIFIMDEGKEIAKGSQREIKNIYAKNRKVEFYANGIDVKDIVAIEEIEGVIKVKENRDKIVVVANNDFRISSVVMTLEGRGKVIDNIITVEEKLESIFLSLTGKSLRD
ncbi:MAG: ABC transporter ATP-binding protein [Sarcina sp.]